VAGVLVTCVLCLTLLAIFAGLPAMVVATTIGTVVGGLLGWIAPQPTKAFTASLRPPPLPPGDSGKP
jgi:hypothetical protein